MRLKSILRTGAIITTFYFGLYGVNTLRTSQYARLTKDTCRIVGSDGAASTTSYYISSLDRVRNMEIISQTRMYLGLVTGKTYVEKNEDDKIDEVDISTGSILFCNSETLTREINYNVRAEEFEKGDRILLETRRRFAGHPYLVEFHKQHGNEN